MQRRDFRTWPSIVNTLHEFVAIFPAEKVLVSSNFLSVVFGSSDDVCSTREGIWKKITAAFCLKVIRQVCHDWLGTV
jgi:hypothetical protein